MDFFEHQDTARKKTLGLVTLFFLAIILIAGFGDIVGYVLLRLSGVTEAPLYEWVSSRDSLRILCSLFIIITGGTLYQFFNLAKGGSAVAQMANARRIAMSANSASERKLINLVEEMSIASGTPIPDIYVMDNETTINAFVAGYEPTEAVLVVTRGLIDNLTRDELQGVIGHEFSHILNGDMRINVRLIAILSGILLIGQVGQFLLRSSYGSRHSRSRKNQGALLLSVVGIAMICVGYIGLFIGRIIKAGISRQREYLADAASVQFTRNPEGIASALYKIMESKEHSYLNTTRHAEDINHLCFSESIKMAFSSLLASHPPLDERISVIDKTFIARFRSRSHTSRNTPPRPQPGANKSTTEATLSNPVSHLSGNGPQQPFGAQIDNGTEDFISTSPKAAAVTAPETTVRPLAETTAKTAYSAITSVGHSSPEHYNYASRLLKSIPADLKALAHSTDGAQALLLSMVLSQTAERNRSSATSALSDQTKAILCSTEQRKLDSMTRAIHRAQRTPIAEMAIATLRGLTPDKQAQFIEDIATLSNADSKITFFELALIVIIKRQLSADYGKKIKSKYHSYQSVINEISLIIRLFSVASTSQSEVQKVRYNEIISSFFSAVHWDKAPKATPERISHSLNKLRLLSPLLKRPFIQACAECVTADDKVEPKEYELLRLVAISLDCPMPPLIISND